MDLKSLLVDTKSAWINYPGVEGFEVEVANLSRKELTKLRKRCLTQKFDRKTRQLSETLDDELFIKEFTHACVKNWKGLTIEGLEALVLIDIGTNDPKKLVEYNKDNAEQLVANSSEFDTWLNEVVFDLDNFRRRTDGDVVEEAK